MKIWVLNPPYFPKFSRPQRSPAVTKSGTVYFPIWLAYCVGVLEADGHEVVFTDAPVSGIDEREACRMAREARPRLIVMDTSTPSIENDLKVAAALKQAQPDAFLLGVGTHVSALPEETLKQCPAVDAVARREYEGTVRDLARVLAEAGDAAPGPEALAAIPGLSFRDGDAIRGNPDRPPLENLDELPWVSKVYQRHLDIRNYFNPNGLYPMVTLITGRGCPYRCSFCVYPQTMTGRRYRFRSVQDVVAEVDFVRRSFDGVRSIWFEDDTLTASRTRCHEFADALIAAGNTLPWEANARCDLDLDTMLKLKRAGCRELCVGFESGEQATLDSMRKGTKAETMFEFMRNARRAGILVHGCFMVGFPGEDANAVARTVDLAIRLKPDTVQFYPMMVYPGTEAYEEYRNKGWLTAEKYSDWLTAEGLHNCVVRNEHLSSRELVRACDRARRRFYLRPAYMAYKLGQVLRRPSEIVRTAKAARVFVRHLLLGSKV